MRNRRVSLQLDEDASDVDDSHSSNLASKAKSQSGLNSPVASAAVGAAWRDMQVELHSVAVDQKRILGELRSLAEAQAALLESFASPVLSPATDHRGSRERQTRAAFSMAPMPSLYPLNPARTTQAHVPVRGSVAQDTTATDKMIDQADSFRESHDERLSRDRSKGTEAEKSMLSFENATSPRHSPATPRAKTSLASSSGEPSSLHMPPNWPREILMREPLRPKPVVRSPHSLLMHENDDLVSLARESTARFLKVAMFHDHPTTLSGVAATYVLKPGSKLRMLLDLASLVVLLYELTLMPVALAWDFPWEGFMSISTWIVCLWWTMDIVWSLRTGFYRNGEMIINTYQIRQRYLRSYFPLDAFLVLGDWATIAFNSFFDPGVAGLTTLSKVLKVTRMVKIARMVRITEVLFRISDRCRFNRNWYVLLEVMAPLLVILWLNHCVACFWYMLGRSDLGDTGSHWLDLTLTDGTTYAESTPIYQYSTAFHWSLTQMTPGSMQVNPLNSLERGFNIVCLIFGLIVFGTLVSSLSAKLMQWRMSRQELNNKLVTLRKFLTQSKVNSALCIRVEKQVIESLTSRKPLVYKDVPVLQVLSLSMRKELRSELAWKPLVSMPLFKMCAQVDVLSVQTICTEAVEMRALVPMENLFLPGTPSHGAFYVKSGELTYKQDPLTARVEETTEDRLQDGTWISEQGLWAEWQHVGTIEANDLSQLIDVNANKCLEILLKTRMLDSLVLEYARVYHAKLTSGLPPWPNDLKVAFTELEDIMLCANEKVRVFVGLIALEALRMKIEKTKQMHGLQNLEQIDELEDEIHESRSLLLLNEKLDVHRIVVATVVQLKDLDDKVFAQIGKWNPDDGFFAECRLPGTKHELEETPEQSLRNLLDGKLQILAASMHLQGFDRRVLTRKSRNFSLPTKYILSEHSATLNPVAYQAECHPALLLKKGVIPVLDAHGRAPARPSKRSSVQTSNSSRTSQSMQVYGDLLAASAGDCLFLFAWLSEGDMEYYTSPFGEQVLESILRCSEEDVKRAYEGKATVYASLQSADQGSISSRRNSQQSEAAERQRLSTASGSQGGEAFTMVC